MDISPIRNDDDHRAALQEIERLWDAPEGSTEHDRLDVLATLAEAYETRRWPVAPGSPRDVLAYAISDLGRSQTDLADLLGSRARASDLLSGRRRVSLQAAQIISKAWSLPIQLLVAPYDTAAA